MIVVVHKYSNFSAISWRVQVNFQWEDDEIRYVLNQHTELDFNSASSLKQQSANRHVVSLGHNILILSRSGIIHPPEILDHKTSITPRHFIEFHVLIQERERSCMLVRGIHVACVSHYFACVSNYCSIEFWKCSNSGVICVKSGVIFLFPSYLLFNIEDAR